MKILLIEDNEPIAKGLAYSFEKNGYTFSYRTSVRKAMEYLSENPDTDLVILDIGLPDGNGFDFYQKELSPRRIPTIFLTAQDDENDVVKGLNIGAEDYVTKPFSTKELMARVRRVLLRSSRQSTITVGTVTFDMDKPAIFNEDQPIELTPMEMKIVSLLFANINKVVTRSTLLDKIWEWTGNYVDDHTVTVYLKRIREKLGADIIITVKGLGYRIDEK